MSSVRLVLLPSVFCCGADVYPGGGVRRRHGLLTVDVFLARVLDDKLKREKSDKMHPATSSGRKRARHSSSVAGSVA